MKRLIPVLLLMLLLSGCSMWSSTYVQVTPSKERTAGYSTLTAPVEDYAGIQEALEGILTTGVESGVIYTVNMDSETLEAYMQTAVSAVQTENAIAAYSVERIAYEVGTQGGKMAAAVNVSYRHGAVEARKILLVTDMEQVEKAIREALEDYSPRVVMEVASYSELDVSHLVREIARREPQIVMEVPEVTQEVYGSGEERILDLTFTYQNSRDALLQMQEQVRPVFDAAALYVSGTGSDAQKLSQLYGFLMERFEYSFGTSITPAYTLLRHGVGDSRAFAWVYAAMCRQAGLEADVITGTRNGQPWTWNIVRDAASWFHVDLLHDGMETTFREYTDAELTGYIWDYSAYPACGE